MADLFPESIHVFGTGMERFTSDEMIWNYAKQYGFAIVTADNDFVRLAERKGTPPQVVFLESCDYKTAIVESVIRRNAVRISDLEGSGRAVLILRNL